jgi:hypothetical protein
MPFALSRKTTDLLQAQLYWVIPNLIGMALFLWFASRTWLEPKLRGVAEASAGDAFVWGVTAFPILAVFIIVNAVWLIRLVYQGLKTKRWLTMWAFALISVLWLTAFMLDGLQHGA